MNQCSENQTEVECHILPNGEIRMVGYAEDELLNLLGGITSEAW